MNRFNYIADHPRRFRASISTTIAIDNRIRGPFAALIATVLLTAAIGIVQLTRLHAAQRVYAATTARVVADGAAVRAITQLRLRVETETQIANRLADMSRVSLERANELAWIGNHLPRDTWLTALRYEKNEYALEGTSTRVSAVGSAMMALRDDTHRTAPQLVWVHDDPGSGARHIHYTLRLSSPP